ncbi:hypothetical protein BC830DRAFT_1156276 [Chytriomyces sp. MP71]|nr:hypothetical protein BC830DRAFT_1156276 [Chytriomyces sp. MP71]
MGLTWIGNHFLTISSSEMRLSFKQSKSVHRAFLCSADSISYLAQAAASEVDAWPDAVAASNAYTHLVTSLGT